MCFCCMENKYWDIYFILLFLKFFFHIYLSSRAILHTHTHTRVVLILGIQCEISKTSVKLQNSVIVYRISKHKRYVFLEFIMILNYF